MSPLQKININILQNEENSSGEALDYKETAKSSRRSRIEGGCIEKHRKHINCIAAPPTQEQLGTRRGGLRGISCCGEEETMRTPGSPLP